MLSMATKHLSHTKIQFPTQTVNLITECEDFVYDLAGYINGYCIIKGNNNYKLVDTKGNIIYQITADTGYGS